MIYALVAWGILIFSLSIPTLVGYYAALHFISYLPEFWLIMAGVFGLATFISIVGVVIFCFLWFSYLFFLVPIAKRECVEKELMGYMNVALMDPIYSTIKKHFVKRVL